MVSKNIGEGERRQIMFPFHPASYEEWVDSLLELQQQEAECDKHITVTPALQCGGCGEHLDKGLAFLVTGFNQCYHVKETCITKLFSSKSIQRNGGFFKRQKAVDGTEQHSI
jgi:hypothetical protein